jgi:hypothetical protein
LPFRLGSSPTSKYLGVITGFIQDAITTISCIAIQIKKRGLLT